MTEQLLLGLDVGTTGVKGLIINVKGEVLAMASSDYPLSTPMPNWAEQDPEDWWNATVRVVRKLTRSSGVTAKDIAGVGISGQMHSLVLLDRNLAVLRPAILWCDTRTDRECRWINEKIGLERLRETVANRALEGFTLPKILWVRSNEPAIYDRIHKVLLPKDYIRFRMTGVISTDVSDASGTLLLDVRKRVWSEPMLSAAGIPAEWLPQVIESTDIGGRISAAAASASGLIAGTPVVGGGGDNACAAVGTGVVKKGRLLASIGTSGVVLAHIDSMKGDPGMRVHTFCHSVPRCWYLIGVVLMAGGAFRWYKETFGQSEVLAARGNGLDAYDVLTEEAARIPAGSEGLFFQPYLAGERTPHQSAAARAGFIGATLRHTKNHFTRAVLEGITYGMNDSLEIIRSLGQTVGQIRLSGGGAKSPFWRQLQADTYGSEVAVVNSSEGPAYGAALLAGAGTNVYKNIIEAVEQTIRVVETREPDMKAADRYKEFYGIYRELYPSLTDIYSKIQRQFVPSPDFGSEQKPVLDHPNSMEKRS
ncbi:MAG TPA: xylulokinase [Bacteroidota bacterium]|nr:xylulokinase [Bacteroidota bacterium]